MSTSLPWMACSLRSARLFWMSRRSSAVYIAYLEPRSSSCSLRSSNAFCASSAESASRMSQIASPAFFASRSALYFWLHPASASAASPNAAMATARVRALVIFVLVMSGHRHAGGFVVGIV